MNTLNLTQEEITRAIKTFDERTIEALRRVPMSLLLTLFNPITMMTLSQNSQTDPDWADTLRALCLDLTGMTKAKVDDFRKQLLTVVGIEIDRRFQVLEKAK